MGVSGSGLMAAMVLRPFHAFMFHPAMIHLAMIHLAVIRLAVICLAMTGMFLRSGRKGCGSERQQRCERQRLHAASAACRTVTTRIIRSEEHTSELQSLMRISYAVFCLKKKNKHKKRSLYNGRIYHK